MPRRLLVAISIGFTALGMAALPAASQTPIAKKFIDKTEAAVKMLQSACSADIQSYCKTVTPGEGRLVFCFLAHEDKVSDKCYNKFFEVAENIELGASNLWRAADVCGKDIEQVCGKVKEGQGRIAQCLIDNKSKISTACRAEVVGIEARLTK